MASSVESVDGEERAFIRSSLERHARWTLGRRSEELSPRERYTAIALAARDVAVERMLETEARYKDEGAKRLYYLSMEFLVGRSLESNLINLGVHEACKDVVSGLGWELPDLLNQEPDAALGNGGLGRLAACFLDSLATLGMPGFGYGINYEFGLFRQKIVNGFQIEEPDHWVRESTPWQIARPEESCVVPVYGHIEHGQDRKGQYNPMWLDWQVIIGVPHDMPVVGYGGGTVNYLRLFSAQSSDEFDMAIFNSGDYLRAVEQKITSETVSKVLYPSDAIASGRELRLVQEYFFVACSIRDIVRRFESEHGKDYSKLFDKVAIQLNDTHPALAVAELQRVLLDEKGLDWEDAWDVTTRTCAYTNHTLLPEALEQWPIELMERVLPRHLQIIFEINRRFLDDVITVNPSMRDRVSSLSLVGEGEQKQLRMAHLAIVGSHSVNGVAALHSELVKTQLVPQFDAVFPGKFNNKTNGVTQRRWLLQCNPGLAELVTKVTGSSDWVVDLDRLRALESSAEDTSFQEDFRRVKLANKERLAREIWQKSRRKVDPRSLFDVQAKRIHEYKRQLLALLQVIEEYYAVVEDGWTPEVPRTHIFAGKAAPGYHAAKMIIKLAHCIADRIHNDPRAREWIQVVFLPDYKVSMAERIIPAADLSEQISTAGMEASGTGNMKFAMNGALTVGTLDGANVEILEEVGEDNIFIFGLTTEEVEARRRGEFGRGPWDEFNEDASFRRVFESIRDGVWSDEDPYRFRWIWDSVMEHGDYYCISGDFRSYLDTQRKIDDEFARPDEWTRKAILNVARMGKFSSDRVIQQYASEIWNICGRESVCLQGV